MARGRVRKTRLSLANQDIPDWGQGHVAAKIPSLNQKARAKERFRLTPKFLGTLFGELAF